MAIERTDDLDYFDEGYPAEIAAFGLVVLVAGCVLLAFSGGFGAADTNGKADEAGASDRGEAP
ncbi:MAG TPA: hypothetical protein VK934_09680 [Fimbriimonas sp.]|nr:hypothetical protein [Fimbriimonas sp.]